MVLRVIYKVSPVDIDIVLDVSDRLFSLLKKDSDILKATIKDFKSTISDVINRLDKNFEKLTKQLEAIKK